MEFVDSIPRQKSGKLLRRILSDRNKGFADYNMMLTPLLDSADTQTVLRLIACGHRGDSLCVHVRVAVLVRQSCTSTVTAVRAQCSCALECTIRHATSDVQRTAYTVRHARHKRTSTTCNIGTTYNGRHATCNIQRTPYSMQRATYNMSHTTFTQHPTHHRASDSTQRAPHSTHSPPVGACRLHCGATACLPIAAVAQLTVACVGIPQVLTTKPYAEYRIEARQRCLPRR